MQKVVQTRHEKMQEKWLRTRQERTQENSKEQGKKVRWKVATNQVRV